MSERLPAVVDVVWLQSELGSDDLFLGDVRGPNAHARGHIPGSKPLVLGSPPPMSDREMLETLAPEVKKAADAWAGCIAGTIPVADYRTLLVSAGFAEAEIEIHQVTEVPEGGKIGSAYIRAVKPATA